MVKKINSKFISRRLPNAALQHIVNNRFIFTLTPVIRSVCLSVRMTQKLYIGSGSYYHTRWGSIGGSVQFKVDSDPEYPEVFPSFFPQFFVLIITQEVMAQTTIYKRQGRHEAESLIVNEITGRNEKTR